jgi:hypothetical protein
VSEAATRRSRLRAVRERERAAAAADLARDRDRERAARLEAALVTLTARRAVALSAVGRAREVLAAAIRALRAIDPKSAG